MGHENQGLTSWQPWVTSNLGQNCHWHRNQRFASVSFAKAVLKAKPCWYILKLTLSWLYEPQTCAIIMDCVSKSRLHFESKVKYANFPVSLRFPDFAEWVVKWKKCKKLARMQITAFNCRKNKLLVLGQVRVARHSDVLYIMLSWATRHMLWGGQVEDK